MLCSTQNKRKFLVAGEGGLVEGLEEVGRDWLRTCWCETSSVLREGERDVLWRKNACLFDPRMKLLFSAGVAENNSRLVGWGRDGAMARWGSDRDGNCPEPG